MGLQAEVITALISYIIATCLLSYFLITIFIAIRNQQFGESPTKTRIQSAFTWSSITCIVSFWLRCIFTAIYFLIITPSLENINEYIFLLAIGWLLYGWAVWSMYLAFVLRIDYTFKGQYHIQYSPLVIKILYVMLAVLFILIVMASITVAMGHRLTSVFFGESVWVFEFIFSCLLSYLLFDKIFIIMRSRLNEQKYDKQQQQHENESLKDKSDGQVIKLTDIKSVTRFALLMFIGIISTHIACIFVTLDVAFAWSSQERLGTLGLIFLAIDTMVKSNSVYLLFQFNNAKYYMVCSGMHNLCQKCCIQCIYQTQKDKTKQECETLIFTQDDQNTDDALL